jgi:hypothetical protein
MKIIYKKNIQLKLLLCEFENGRNQFSQNLKKSVRQYEN